MTARRVPARTFLGAALVVVLLAGLAGCRWRPPAATVNGQDITAQDVQDDIDTLKGNPELASFLYSTTDLGQGGTVPSAVTASVLTGRILEQLVADGYARSSKRLSPEDEARQRETLTASLLQALGGDQALLDRIPGGYRDRLVERAVAITALLTDVADADVQTTMRAVLTQGHVTIDPKYGTWDEQTLTVVPNQAPGFGASPRAATTDGAGGGAGSRDGAGTGTGNGTDSTASTVRS